MAALKAEHGSEIPSEKAGLPETSDATENELFGDPEGDGEELQSAIQDSRLHEIENKWEKAPVEDVALDKIEGHQGVVTHEGVQRALDNPEYAKNQKSMVFGDKELPGDLPVVLKMGDHMVVQDGNHRTVAALLRGDKTMRARVIELQPISTLRAKVVEENK